MEPKPGGPTAAAMPEEKVWREFEERERERERERGEPLSSAVLGDVQHVEFR